MRYKVDVIDMIGYDWDMWYELTNLSLFSISTRRDIATKKTRNSI